MDTEFGTWLSNGLLAGKGCHCHLGPGVAITPVRTLGSTSGQQAGFPGGVRQILFYGRTHRNRCLACPHAQGPATFEEYLPCIPPQQGMLTLKCQTGEYKRTLPGHQSPGKGILKCELIHHHDLPDRRSNHYIAQKISSTLNVEEPFLLSPRQLELYHWLLRACLETSAFIVTRRHVDKKRLCAAAKTREDCQTVPQRSDGQRMGACTSSPAPCFWRRSEAQNRPA